MGAVIHKVESRIGHRHWLPGLCLGVTLASKCLAQLAPLPQQGAPTPGSPSAAPVTLPSISHVWRPDEVASAPAITIGDLERCMGTDVSLQARVSALHQRQSGLDAQKLELDKSNATLTDQKGHVEQEVQQLRVQFEALRASGVEMQQRLDQINLAKSNANLSASQARSLASDINAYNAVVAGFKVRRNQLMKSQSQVNERVKALNDQAGQVNEQVATYNAQAQALRDDVQALAQSQSSFAGQCTGMRKIQD